MSKSLRFNFLSFLLTMAVVSQTAFGQSDNYDPDQMREEVNRGTVMIQGAKQDSAFTRLANDIATVVDSSEIRVLPLLGKGSFQNIQDLMFLAGVDAAFTQADTLDFYKSIGVLPHIERDLRYIMRTSNEEFHLLARSTISSIQDLEGKKVNFGRPGTGTFTTASVLFDRLGVSVEATTHPHKTALALLQRGELDAMAKVDGKPVGVISEASLDDGLQLLDIPLAGLEDVYEDAQLTHADYPSLFAEGDSVNTVAVASLLAVYNFPPGHARGKKVDRFIRALFDKIDELQNVDAGGDAKWAEIDVSDEVPGWTRHSTAAELLTTQ